jgi:formylglycine-generating enzyme required for sulfatase activity
MVDAVVAQAVRRLATVYAIEPGAAHDAISAWARALDVGYSGATPSSVPTTSVGGDRLGQKIQKFLDLAEAAEDAGRWQEALEAYNDILALDPAHEEALRFRGVAQRRLGILVSATPAPGPAQATPSGAAEPSMEDILASIRRILGEDDQPAKLAAAASAPAASGGPSWRAGWMTDCGADANGHWAVASIAGVDMRFRYCPPGKFLMGSPWSEAGRVDDEGPQHEVSLTQGFWLGEKPVTQRQWNAVAGKNQSHFKGPDLPVDSVTWEDCQEWMKKASACAVGPELRFPTEAEWEYACRAGTVTPFSFGATINPEQANYDSNFTYGSGRRGVYRWSTVPVGLFPANNWGLHDMHGNVWEWVEDCYVDSYVGAPLDGSIAVTGGDCSWRVLRGGSWFNGPRLLRSACRLKFSPGYRYYYTGFRVARAPGG